MKSIRLEILTLILFFGSSVLLSQNYLQSFDGVNIAYEEYGEGETTLFFVHCWMCNQDFWKNQINVFSKDYRVVTIDLAGHGKSGDERETWSVQSLAKDVTAVANQLGLEKIILICHSMGGPVSLFAAKMLGDRVIGVVGVDNFQNVDAVATQEQAEQFTAPMKADFKNAVHGFVTYRMFPAGSDSVLVKKIADSMSDGHKQAGIDLMIEMFTNTAKPLVENLKVPLVVIYSDLFPIEYDALDEAAADVDSIMINGVGHFPHMEKPDNFNTLLKRAVTGIVNK